MARLCSHKIAGRGSRERLDMLAPLNHAVIGWRGSHDSAYMLLEFSDGERRYTLTMNSAEFRSMLKNALSVDIERLSMILRGAP